MVQACVVVSMYDTHYGRVDICMTYFITMDDGFWIHFWRCLCLSLNRDIRIRRYELCGAMKCIVLEAPSIFIVGVHACVFISLVEKMPNLPYRIMFHGNAGHGVIRIFDLFRRNIRISPRKEPRFNS